LKLFSVFSLSTRDQSATQGNDYPQNTVSLTFNPGDPQERNVPIQILEDTLIENTETLSVELTTTDTDIVFSNGNTASITITDDDGMLSLVFRFCCQLRDTGTLYPEMNDSRIAWP
jgi:hypothetical protein